MMDIDWSVLTPLQRLIVYLLVTSAATGVVSVALLAVSSVIKWWEYREARELNRTAHDMLKLNKALNEDTRAKVGGLEKTAERVEQVVAEKARDGSRHDLPAQG